MKTHLLVNIFLVAISISACIREPACEIDPTDGNLQIIFHWPETLKKQPGVFISFYAVNANTPINDFLPPEGGRIFIPQGEYDILVYNNNSETILFRDLNAFKTVEAFVEKDNQPDQLLTGNRQMVMVENTFQVQTVEIEMASLVKNYPFTFRGVTGINNVSRIQAYVSGISMSVNLAEPTQLLPTDSIRCSFNRTADGFSGSFNSFGHGGNDTVHFFTVRFESGGSSKTYTYNVTEMLNQQERIDIYDKIVFEPVNDGGFRPGVDDWEDDSAVVPL